MKKIKSILLAFLIVTITLSCENDGGKSVRKFIIGATPNITKLSTSDQSINYIALQNDEDIDLGFTVAISNGNVASANVVGYYYSDSGVEKAVFASNITTFPSTFHLDQNDLYDAFNINSAADIKITDKLIITTDLTLKDGRIVKMYTDDGVKNYGADVTNQSMYSAAQTYIFSCPLDNASNFNGNYEVVVDDWADYEPGEIVPVVYDSSFGTLKFKILNTNNPYVSNTNSYYIITIDPTNSSVNVASNENFDYGGGFIVPITGTGAVGSCTGDIVITQYFGPYGPYNLELKKVN